MKHPNLKFKISAQKDIESFYSFVGQSCVDQGRSLRWAILKPHPLLKQAIKNNKVIDKVFAERYIRDCYRGYSPIALRNMKRYETDWRKKEKQYFMMTDEIFGDFPWPKGKYIAYSTIWGMFPRFLADKTFQVPMQYPRKKYIPVVIAHETLHFRFYAYVEKYYPRYRDPERNMLLWHISEIFNILVINSPAWFKFFGIKNILYPEHRKIIMELRKKYPDAASFDIDAMIRDIDPFARELMKKNI